VFSPIFTPILRAVTAAGSDGPVTVVVRRNCHSIPSGNCNSIPSEDCHRTRSICRGLHRTPSMTGVRKTANGSKGPVEGMVCTKARASGAWGCLAWDSFLVWVAGVALAVPCKIACMHWRWACATSLDAGSSAGAGTGGSAVDGGLGGLHGAS
jgi:hypothetical protein